MSGFDSPDHRQAGPPLSAILACLPALEADLRNAPTFTIHVLRHLTVEGLEPHLRWHAAQDGLRVHLSFGGYGTFTQEVLAGVNADLVVLALDLEALDPDFGLPGWSSTRVLQELLNLMDLLERKTQATVVAHRFLLPAYPPGGNLLLGDGMDVGTQIHALNAGLAEFVRSRAPRFQLLDWDRHLRELGRREAMDLRFSYQARAPFRPAFMDCWARDLCRILRALSGRTRKCLVLDCDNTLWGGVVGEDGPGGIALDAHAYPGRAFHDFQRGLLALQARGVLLALCSRNNEADVWEVLDGHPDCLLRREHLAAWRISWEDKAASLASIAAELNLGLDAFVFVDDNPAECARIREALPAVRVLQVPRDLWELPDLVFHDGLFDTLAVGEEDRSRTELYRGEAQRTQARTDFPDLDSYLISLSMRAWIRPATTMDLARAAQLTQKTNQFNLTTQRFGEAELARLAADPESAVLVLDLEDRFGRLGTVGVLVARREGRQGHVINLLLSCRALGRRAEQAFAARGLRELEARWGLEEWTASYRPSPKNAQTQDFWDQIGFTRVRETMEGRSYRLKVGQPPLKTPECITVRED